MAYDFKSIMTSLKSLLKLKNLEPTAIKNLEPAATNLKLVIDYHENNVIKEIYYLDDQGKINGWHKVFHDNGVLFQKTEYKNGKEDGRSQAFYPDGNLAKNSTYKNGELDGFCEWLFRSGDPAKRCTYKNGELEGLFEKFHTNGNVHIRATYKNGKLDGFYEEFDCDGNLIEKIKYENGNKLEVLITTRVIENQDRKNELLVRQFKKQSDLSRREKAKELIALRQRCK